MRDRLLGMRTLDIDLACSGDVKRFGKRLALELGREFFYYSQFKTGTIEGPEGQRIDLAMTRKERYPVQGELPKVQKAGIEEDLYRRDFTVNAMAISLNDRDFGEILDPLDAARDLERGLIRVIHEKSFADDPTRIFRAVRYAERLGFRIEVGTLRLLKEAAPSIKKLSGERLLYELRCVVCEGRAIGLRIVQRLSKLGALEFLGVPIVPLSVARLARLKTEEGCCEFLCLLFSHFAERAISRLPLGKSCLATVATLRKKKEIFQTLARLNPPSRIAFFLNAYDARGLAILARVEEARAAQKIATYLDVYRNITIRTTGDDLVKLGVRPGPRYKELLDAALAARIDGKVKSKREELALIKKLIRS